MSERMEFCSYPKVARLDKPWVMTEKIDGTNGQIYISDYLDDQQSLDYSPPGSTIIVQTMYGWVHIKVGSRNRWLSGGSDNFGFYNWVWENCQEAAQLGPGRHFGEWWGKGIQRGYGLSERRFSLFNVDRWKKAEDGSDPTPACFHVVPVLHRKIHLMRSAPRPVPGWDLCSHDADVYLNLLKEQGSKAAPGFMNPEGLMLFHTGSHTLLKHTFEGPKHGNKKAG